MAGLLTAIPTEQKRSEAIGLYPKKGKEALLFHMQEKRQIGCALCGTTGKCFRCMQFL